MAKLSRLIQGQDVAFDTHQAGDSQPVNWQALHLEKRLHRGGKIRFPFFGSGEPSWSEGVSQQVYERVVREVRRTLGKNIKLQDQLAETITSQIFRFSSGSVTIEDAQQAARNIAHAFDLSKKFVSTATFHANSQIIGFSSLHLSVKAGAVIEIVQSADGIVVQKPKESWEGWRNSAS